MFRPVATRRVLCLALGLLAACTPGVRAEVIDRVLAIVEGHIITMSDARAVLSLGLVPQDVSVDPVSASLQRLIDRRLMLVDVDRYAPPEPSEEAVNAAMLQVERRFEDALGLEIALNRTAMSRDGLRRYLRDSLRIDAYLEGRFATAVQPSEEDVVRYYREHPDEFTANGRLQPLEEVRPAARAGAERVQRAAVVDQWVASLRRRGSVSVLYLPSKK